MIVKKNTLKLFFTIFSLSILLFSATGAVGSTFFTHSVNAQGSDCRPGYYRPAGTPESHGCLPMPANHTVNTPSRFSGDCKDDQLDKDNCGIVAYLVLFIQALSALVGIVIVLVIVISGIQYTAARENPQWVSAAKDRIREAVFALLIYLVAFAFLNWLIPGGLI